MLMTLNNKWMGYFLKLECKGLDVCVIIMLKIVNNFCELTLWIQAPNLTVNLIVYPEYSKLIFPKNCEALIQ